VGIRSQVKGDEAATQLRTAFSSATIPVWFVELELYDSIRVFPDQCVTLPRIGVAILNAGLVNMSYAILPATKHGFAMQANYLSTELLAILFLPILRAKRVASAAGPPLLTVVMSDAAYGADIETASRSCRAG
jgi:hypothetical protein